MDRRLLVWRRAQSSLRWLAVRGVELRHLLRVPLERLHRIVAMVTTGDWVHAAHLTRSLELL